MNEREQKTTDDFHNLYYNGLEGESEIYLRTNWMNVPCQKCPLDLWIYQEIFAELKPDLIVETGTYYGGSALYMAHVLDALGKGEIITIDISDRTPRPPHPRITYVTGSSADDDLVQGLLGKRPDEVRLVILDSDHSKNHVLEELRIFSPFVSIGSYLIVEDTNINGHPTYPSFGAGPFEAVDDFLQGNPNFVVDSSREKFLMTFNPGGFLKRIS
jgi:cephalosporin hydroxylase